MSMQKRLQVLEKANKGQNERIEQMMTTLARILENQAGGLLIKVVSKLIDQKKRIVEDRDAKGK